MGKGQGMGISRMIEVLKAEVPSLQFGYFNRTKEHFKLNGVGSRIPGF